MTNWHAPWNQIWIDWLPNQLRAPSIDIQKVDLSQTLSAQEAWAYVLPLAKQFDPDFKLRSIKSVGTADLKGRANGWEFCVDAPTRRAKGVFCWTLQGEGSQIKRDLSPFPAIGSPIQMMVASGHGNNTVLETAWHIMRKDAIDIGSNFEDSGAFFVDLKEGSASLSQPMLVLDPSSGSSSWRDDTFTEPLRLSA